MNCCFQGDGGWRGVRTARVHRQERLAIVKGLDLTLLVDIEDSCARGLSVSGPHGYLGAAKTSRYCYATRLPMSKLSIVLAVLIVLLFQAVHLDAKAEEDVLDVRAQPFAAKCDSATDDYRAFQAAIDAACSNEQALYISAGRGNKDSCMHSKPLVAHCGIHMFGRVALSHIGSSSLRPLNYAGPDLLVENPDVAPLATGPPLVGAGKSYKVEPNNAIAINLRQTATAELDGLTAVTAEGAFELVRGASNVTLVASSGGLSALSELLPQKNTDDLAIYVSAGTLIGTLRVQQTLHTLHGGSVAGGLRHYVALVYDGKRIELYLDGKEADVQSASGRITQDITDDVTIGLMNQTGPEGAIFFGSDPGTLIDSVRISDVPRYSGPAMPIPALEFENDSHTIALVNFDDNTPPGFILVEQGASFKYPRQVYSVLERYKTVEDKWAPFVAGVYVHDLWFQGGLWCWRCTYGSRFDNLLFQYGDVGLVLGGNSNEDVINNLSVVKGGPAMRYGLLMEVANGSRVNGAFIDGTIFPLVIQGAARTWLSDLQISTEQFTKYGVLTIASAPSFRGLYFDEEGQTPPGFVGSLVELSNWAPGEVSGLEIDNYADALGQPVIVDGSNRGNGVTITAGSIGNSGIKPPVHISGLLSSPVILSNVLYAGPGPLTNSVKQTIVIGQ